MTEEEKAEVIKRGYAQDLKEWWLLVDHHWNDLDGIIHSYAIGSAQDALRAKLKRSPEKLWKILNEAWFNAPDNATIHKMPGWGILCDLCSEYPHKEQETGKVGIA